MEGGGWRVEGRGWRVEGGGLRVEGGGCRVSGSELRVEDVGYRMARPRPSRPARCRRPTPEPPHTQTLSRLDASSDPTELAT